MVFYGFAKQERRGMICRINILPIKLVIGIFKAGFNPEYGTRCYGALLKISEIVER